MKGDVLPVDETNGIDKLEQFSRPLAIPRVTDERCPPNAI